MSKSIRVSVEQIEEDGRRKWLHQDFSTVEKKITIERTVRVMLARAAERFPDPPKCVQRHD